MISLWRRPSGGMASKDAGRIVVKRLGESFGNRSAQSAGLMYFWYLWLPFWCPGEAWAQRVGVPGRDVGHLGTK